MTLHGRQLTTQEIRRYLPGIPQATLYRHINRLVDAGILRVAEQRQVHGTVERTWALVHEATQMSAGDLTDLSPDELSRVFSTFVGGIMELFDRYAHSSVRDLGSDNLAFYGEMVYLTDDEAAEARRRMRELVQGYASNPAIEGRKRRMLAVFSVPDATLEADNVSDERESREGTDG